MDARLNKTRRSSRWTRDPVIDDGKAVVVYPTDRDIEIFRLLTRYRYLPSDYIHVFVGGSSKGLNRRLNLLSRKPNLYLARPHQQRDCASANHRSGKGGHSCAPGGHAREQLRPGRHVDRGAPTLMGAGKARDNSKAGLMV